MGAMKARLLLVAPLLWACASGPGPVDVRTESALPLELQGFRTYAVVPPDTGIPAVRDRIENEIEIVLDDRGFRRVTVTQADMVVAFRGSGRPVTRVHDTGDAGATFYRVEKYTEGTLVISIFDTTREKRVWRGTGQIDVRSKDRRIIARDAAHAVDAVLEKFPAQPATP
jgi:hypothetical protein